MVSIRLFMTEVVVDFFAPVTPKHALRCMRLNFSFVLSYIILGHYIKEITTLE